MSPENIGNPGYKSDDHLTVEKIIKHYKDYPSIETINKICTKKENFEIPAATTEEINKIIKELDSQKATSLDKIPPKIVKMSSYVLDFHLANVVNIILQRMLFLKRQK